MREAILKEIRDALEKGDREAVSRLTKKALDEGLGIKTILNDCLVAAMEAVGAKFKKSEIFIPEVLISAKAMHAGMAVLEPHFVKAGIKPIGKVVIGTVKGDLHDIGKNIVSMMLKGACLEIHDIGIDASPEKFIETLKKTRGDILAMSALLTTSMGAMRDTINALKDSGLRDKVKVMVGGAPVTKDYADQIGADGYAKDAAVAVDLARELLKRS